MNNGIPVVQVVCGVLVDGAQILIARRPSGKIGAGKWEFPGGKIEPGETPHQALARELDEELGVRVTAAEPVARLRHAYRDRIIWLDTWRVTAFSGTPQPREGQTLAWVSPDEAKRHDLLGSSWRVLAALRLPCHYVFTPPVADTADWLPLLPALPRGAWLRLRRPGLRDDAYVELATRVMRACRMAGVTLVVDRVAALGGVPGAVGLHVDGGLLIRSRTRPVGHEMSCIASVHTAAELAHAYALDVDAAVLSPVCATSTHPGVAGMGWPAFAALVQHAGLPVYALGGVGSQDLATAQAHGGFGVAGISAYWSVPSSRNADSDSGSPAIR